MEAIILQGGSKSSTRLLMELARKLNFKARKLSSEETHMKSRSQKNMNKSKWVPFNRFNKVYSNEIEEMGLILSIHEGLDSGLIDDSEKESFLKTLRPLFC